MTKKWQISCYVLGVWDFISSPPFFQSDVKFRQDVHGMQPEANKYEFMMGFDPVYVNFERKIHFIFKL